MLNLYVLIWKSTPTFGAETSFDAVCVVAAAGEQILTTFQALWPAVGVQHVTGTMFV